MKENSIHVNSLQSIQLNYALYALQIHAAFIILSLISLIFLNIYVPTLFMSKYFNNWNIIFTILLSISLLINYLFISYKHLKIFYKKIFIYTYAIVSSSFLVCLYYILDFSFINQPHYYPTIMTIIIIYYGFSHISSLFFLTYDYKAFLIFIIPTFFPLLHFIYHIPNAKIDIFLFLIIFYTYLAILVGIGFIVSKFHKKSITNIFNLQQLKSQSIIYQNRTDKLEHELAEKKQHYDSACLKIENQQIFIDSNVNEYRQTIEKLNQRLETMTDNFDVIHKIACIASWNWDIQKDSIKTKNFYQTFGYEIKEISYSEYIAQFIHPNDAELFVNQMQHFLQQPSDQSEFTYRFRHKTNGWLWVHDICAVAQRDKKTNKIIKMFGILKDITDEKKSQEKLNLSRMVFNKMDQGLFILDEKLNYIDANPYFLALVNLNKDQLIGKYIFSISTNYKPYPDLNPLHVQVLTQLNKLGKYNTEITENFFSKKDIPLWMHINAIYGHQQEITNYIGIVTNLTERKATEEQLSYLKNYDALTDLPNRYYFNHKLHDAINHLNDTETQFCIIRINIDRFRYYNELLTQEGGDHLLKQVALRLRSVAIDAIIIARLNTDDFSIMLKIEGNSPEASITAYCKQIMLSFESPFNINQQEFILTISIGVAIFPQHGRQMDTLNHHAEVALFEAKSIGGNTLKIYHPDDYMSSEPRLILERELRHAIRNKELVLFFQPKFDAQSMIATGFEALIRWQHPQRGLISPAQFIPLAEETSLISEIGTQVLEMACAQIKIWSNLGFNSLSIAINVDVQQIYRGDLLNEVDFMLKKYNINPQQLELEITETSLMGNNAEVCLLMDELHQRHIKIALDDFGIGYSSLSYLTNYTFDVIKIDRSFVNGVGNDNKEAILRAILIMAKSMNKIVVAEGVETTEQAEFLVREGCDYLQGYLFAKPMSEEMATQFLNASPIPHLANLSILK